MCFSTRLHGNCISAILLYVSESGNEGTSDHAELGTPIRYQQLGSTCTDCTQSCLNALHRYTAVYMHEGTKKPSALFLWWSGHETKPEFGLVPRPNARS